MALARRNGLGLILSSSHGDGGEDGPGRLRAGREESRMKLSLSPADREVLRKARAIRAAWRKEIKRRTKRVLPEAPEQRQPRVRDRVYLSWIRRLPCIACLVNGQQQQGATEAAHVRSGYPQDGWRPTGMAEKPGDRRTAPLCSECHRTGPEAQHGSNERRWWEALGIHPPALCAALSKAFDEDRDGALVVQMFASAAVTAKRSAQMSKTSEEIA